MVPRFAACYALGMTPTDNAKPSRVDPLMITRGDAAKALGVSVRTLERWVAEGRLPARQTGKRWLIATADLRAFVDSLPRVNPPA